MCGGRGSVMFTQRRGEFARQRKRLPIPPVPGLPRQKLQRFLSFKDTAGVFCALCALSSEEKVS